jgi:hypothetical protein
MIILMIALMACMLLMASAAGGVIEGANTMTPSLGTLRNAGAPVNGTNEVQTLTIGGAPTAGAGSGIQFQFQGLTSALALWSATNATFVANVQAALDAMFGSGATVVAVGTATAGVGTFTITFSGAVLAARNLGAAMGVINSMTGTAPTAAVTRTTPGVDATFRNSAPGQLLMDTTNKLLYQNQGTQGAPSWVGIV